ncbi:hypothetical protein KAR02_05130, partial [Candidatus Bipolaricaulota bacterium]|nr:hypothetical protein [Candidatus Bipolaricaulota bacterium]
MIQGRRGFYAILAIVLAVAVLGNGQTPSSDWISEIGILGLVPLEVTFRLTNSGSTSLHNVRGQAILSDQFGQAIEVLAID